MREPIIRNLPRRSTNPVPPPEALLCERCGYVLDGLAAEGKCPECGKPIGESLPSRRVGTPWQQKPGVKSWWATSVGMVVRTRTTFEDLRVPMSARKCGSSTGLSICNCCSAIAPFAILAMAFQWWAGLGLFIVAAIVLLVLTETEALGLRLIARRRGWRVSWKLARAICSHASIGWAALFPFAVVSWLFLVVVQVVLEVAPWSDWLFISNMVIWFLPPMLCFETLAYLGLRACKFANSDACGTANSPAQQSPRP